MTDDRMKRGAQIRAEVLGQAHVSQPGPNPSKFQKAFQDFTVEHCWGNVWVRPGLERKTREHAQSWHAVGHGTLARIRGTRARRAQQWRDRR